LLFVFEDWAPFYNGVTREEACYSLPIAMQKAGARTVGIGWGMDPAARAAWRDDNPADCF